MHNHASVTAHNFSVKRANCFTTIGHLPTNPPASCLLYVYEFLLVLIGEVSFFLNYCLLTFLHYLPYLSGELYGRRLVVQVCGSFAQETPVFNMAHSRKYLDYTLYVGEKFSI